MNNISINNMTLNDIIQTVIQFQEKKKKITEGNTRRHKRYVDKHRDQIREYNREYIKQWRLKKKMNDLNNE